jgi:NAD(P)-dependent dehydrogenase (short-subunit alcohol dehydrogenase family)/acyl dehydratase
MALNLEAVGRPLGPVTKQYSWKETILYALGVGAGFQELEYVFEKDLKVLPSFAVASVFDFFWTVASAAEVDLAGLLHGDQDLVLHRPLPREASLSTTGRIVDIFDLGRTRGAVIKAEAETRDEQETLLFTTAMTLVARRDGGFGGKAPPKGRLEMPDRQPDVSVQDLPATDQPLLYRLSGDTFQLHADPDFARQAGFEQPIMHGLCTYGFACRALIGQLIPGEPERIRRLSCRFSRPLYPGTPISTHIWKDGDHRALWRVVNAETGETIIDQGICEYTAPAVSAVDFSGRVALIVEAGGLTGRSCARELAGRGAAVMISSSRAEGEDRPQEAESPAERLVREIRASGGQAGLAETDADSETGADGLVQETLDRFGRLDVLLIDAAAGAHQAGLGLDPVAWRAATEKALNRVFFGCRAAMKPMKEQGGGRILVLTSAEGLLGQAGWSAQAASGFGLIGFLNSLALEGARQAIRVNCLACRQEAEELQGEEASDPASAASLAVALLSDSCPATGAVYLAASGRLRRLGLVTGQGAVCTAEGSPPAPEAVQQAMESIRSLDQATVYQDLNQQVAEMVEAVKRHMHTGGGRS